MTPMMRNAKKMPTMFAVSARTRYVLTTFLQKGSSLLSAPKLIISCVCANTQRRKAYGCWYPHPTTPGTLGPAFKEKRSTELKRQESDTDPTTPDDVQEVSSRYQSPTLMNEDSCTDAYLRSIGVKPQRHNYPKKVNPSPVIPEDIGGP